MQWMEPNTYRYKKKYQNHSEQGIMNSCKEEDGKREVQKDSEEYKLMSII